MMPLTDEQKEKITDALCKDPEFSAYLDRITQDYIPQQQGRAASDYTENIQSNFFFRHGIEVDLSVDGEVTLQDIVDVRNDVGCSRGMV